MTEAQLRAWMDAYGEAFARQDADAAAALFTPDGTYEWGPFGELLRGRDEIRAKWIEAADASTATFDYEVIAVTEDVGIARWLATHTYPDRLMRYDGIFVVRLSDGLCTEFREWWNVREEAAPG